MEVISGFEGKDIEEAIRTIKEIWEKQGTKPKGGHARYQLLISKLNGRAIFVPTVSTRAGTETVIVWNLTLELAKKLETEAKKTDIPIGYRSYLGFDKPPALLPNEEQREEFKEERE